MIIEVPKRAWKAYARTFRSMRHAARMRWQIDDKKERQKKNEDELTRKRLD